VGHIARAKSFPNYHSRHYRGGGDDGRLQELPARLSGGIAFDHGRSPTETFVAEHAMWHPGVDAHA
jgi:hypothetical protein